MALPSSGAISLSQLQTEFGGANPISMSEYYRGGSYTTSNNTNVPTSGAISLNNFYSAKKQFIFSPTISGYITNYNVRSEAIAAGWDGSTPLIATITNNGVIGSNSTSLYAFDTDSGYPVGSTIALINNSYITGRGGNGANYGPNNGSSGGPALIARVNISITNNSIIQGGGGGGGAGQYPWGGGGGGGGYPGGTGGIGGGYDDGQGPNGRNGTLTAGGIGGYYYGGAGGKPGASGGSSSTSSVGYGGPPGQAITLNGNISWISTGTIYGPIS